MTATYNAFDFPDLRRFPRRKCRTGTLSFATEVSSSTYCYSGNIATVNVPKQKFPPMKAMLESYSSILLGARYCAAIYVSPCAYKRKDVVLGGSGGHSRMSLQRE